MDFRLDMTENGKDKFLNALNTLPCARIGRTKITLDCFHTALRRCKESERMQEERKNKQSRVKTQAR